MTEKKTSIVVLETARSVWEHIAFVSEWRICTAVALDQVNDPSLSADQRRLLLEKLFAGSSIYKTMEDAGTVAYRLSDDMAAHCEPPEVGVHMPYSVVFIKSVEAFSEPLDLDKECA
jgi:hypothetical protein